MDATTYGRYKVLRELGRGAMAVVYLAEDATLMRQVALKRLFPQYATNDGFRERFEREARILARVHHESIVPIFDFGEQDGVPFIVMEFMPGGTLAERIEGGTLSIHEALEILERVAAGLDAAHAAGIIHRDLKPANILFDDKNRAFVGDFGVGRMDTTSVGTTMPGTVIGTAQYMSPEQINGAPPTPAADIYSFGVLAYEALAHRQPFLGDTVWAVMRQHQERQPAPLSAINPRLSFADETILQALEKAPNLRPATAANIAARLREGYRRSEADFSHPSLSVQAAGPGRARSRSTRLILGSGLTAIVVAGTGVTLVALLAGSGPTQQPTATADAQPATAASTPTTEVRTATPTPPIMKTASGTVVIDEHFDGPTGAVSPAEGRSGRGFIEMGVFVVEDFSATDNQYPQSVLIAGGANHSISVDAFAPAGTILLTCRGSDRFDVRALVRQTSGEVRVEVLDKGQAKITTLRDWANASAVHQDASNRLELICEGDEVTLVVNHVVEAEATVPGVEGELVSFGVDGGGSATFDNLEIRKN